MRGKMTKCPFCGGDGDICIDYVVWAFCEDCEASTPDCATAEEAEALWNKGDVGQYSRQSWSNETMGRLDTSEST